MLPKIMTVQNIPWIETGRSTSRCAWPQTVMVLLLSANSLLMSHLFFLLGLMKMKPDSFFLPLYHSSPMRKRARFTEVRREYKRAAAFSRTIILRLADGFWHWIHVQEVSGGVGVVCFLDQQSVPCVSVTCRLLGPDGQQSRVSG